MINTAAIAKLVKELRDYMLNPAYKEFLEMSAEMRRDKFNAYIKAGFTEQQALELCSKEVM